MRALDALHTAVQAFSNSLCDDETDAGVVTSALIVWQESCYEDGDLSWTMHYAITGDGNNPVVGLGLATKLQATIQRDLIGCSCEQS